MADGVSRHSGGACVLQHLGPLVAKPVGSTGPRFAADKEGAWDDGDGSTSNVVWQVAAGGALRRQALEKLGRRIRAWAALAPSLKHAPRTFEERVDYMGLAMSDLRAL